MLFTNINRALGTIGEVLKALVEVPRSHQKWLEQHRSEAEAVEPESKAEVAGPAVEAIEPTVCTFDRVIQAEAPVITIEEEVEAQDSDLLSCETQDTKPPTQPQLTKQQARRIELFGLLDDAWAQGITKYEAQLKYIKAHSADGRGTSKRTVAAWKQQREQDAEAQSA
jgi:hypothetical protein